MAKRSALPGISAKRAAKKLRKVRSGPTFIQRSRSVSSEQKAIYHNVTGAGKSGVKRQFFEIGDDDAKAIKDGVEKLMAAEIAKAGT
jgi:hypothetical protein